MTYGKRGDHPFTAALKRWAPDYVTQYFDDIPETFPHPRAIQAMKAKNDSVQSGLVLQRQIILRKKVSEWQVQADHTAKALRYMALKSTRRIQLKEEALKKQKRQERHNKEACEKPTACTQTGYITEELIKAKTVDKGLQCPEPAQTHLTPEMMADVIFLKKAVALYQAHKSEMATVEPPLQSAPLEEPLSTTDKSCPKLSGEIQDTSSLVVKTGYTISKIEGIKITKRGGKNLYTDDRRWSPVTNEWVTKEQAEAERASGRPLKKHQRISKGNSDLSRIKEKIMGHISEKYRVNRRAIYARSNMNRKLKKNPTDKASYRNKAEASFQKTMSHKKLIEYFQFTVAALGDKALPPEFDCTAFPDENSEAYYHAVINSYKGEIISAQGSMTEVDDDNRGPVKEKEKEVDESRGESDDLFSDEGENDTLTDKQNAVVKFLTNDGMEKDSDSPDSNITLDTAQSFQHASDSVDLSTG